MSEKEENEEERMSEEKMSEEPMSFWEHLDVLRGTIWRIALASVVCGIVAFCLKDELFDIILAPKDAHFVTYRLFERIGSLIPGSEGMGHFSVDLVNTGLAGQFAIHMKVALYAGLAAASPYTIYLLLRFITPALYEGERRYTYRLVGGGYVMFVLGMLLNYFLIFPFTFRFLGTYQVSAEVANMITLDSYIDTLMMLSLMLGILFELPCVCWILGKMGILTRGFMRHYRRHAIVAILIVAAVITPTSDVFTLTLVSLPIWLLYELSILFVPRGEIR